MDLSEFERLVANGRAALGRGEPALCAQTLDRALSMFPGSALVGVRPGVALAGVVDMLAEQRLAATEDFYAAELALGRHAALVTSLRRHVAVHPLRERAWGQLMTALYRCGDTAGALHAFGLARTTLITELGIEPGPHLQTPHRAMLRHSPDLDAPTVRPPVRHARGTQIAQAAVKAPHELPRATPWFTARRSELTDIRDAVEQDSHGPVVIAVNGCAGVGASALVIQAAARRLRPDDCGRRAMAEHIDGRGGPAGDRAGGHPPARHRRPRPIRAYADRTDLRR